jgi:hypothetical protein
MGQAFSEEGARRARVQAQLLDGRGAPRRDVAAVVSGIVGVQAQDMTAAELSIRARTTGIVRDDIYQALADTRSLVLIWSLRGTRHLHHAGDVRWLLALLGPVFGRPGRRSQQLGIAGDVGDNAVRVIRAALMSQGSLTRREVKDLVARHGVDPSGQAPIHVLHRAAFEGVLCIVPGPDGQERYVSLDEWVPQASPVPLDEAAARLARRFLAAYGPATPADFAAWSGLRTATAKQAWTAMSGELTDVDLPAGPAWVLASRRHVIGAAANHPMPVRLVGAFDALLLGYADRSLHVPPARARGINAGGGLIRPVVLADGKVVATWKYHSAWSSHRVQIAPFGAFTADERAGLEYEVRDIGRFLGTAPRLMLNPRQTVP